MGWISEALQTRAETSGISNPSNWLFDALGGAKAYTGKRIDEDTALTYSAVWASVRLLSETVASLPLITYERMDEGTKSRALRHPASAVLHDNVNENQTAFEWLETTMAHLCLRGNSFSWVERDKGSRITGLFILDPRYMHVFPMGDGSIFYSWEPPDLPPLRAKSGLGDIVHIRGFCSNEGLLGCSPITMARESIALGLSAEEYGARFFSNGVTPSGVLEHPAVLDEAAQERLSASLDRYRSVANAHKTLVLEQGMKWSAMGVSPEDAQMIESRKFQINDIARWFRVPPHMIGDLQNATFSNIEHQGIDFVVHSIRPWLVRIEKALKRDLLLPAERSKYYFEFLVDALLRGDSVARSQVYASGKQWGYYSTNDIRAFENLNPVDGGDVYMQPLNMVPMGSDTDLNMPPEGRSIPIDVVKEQRSEKEIRATRSVGLRRKIGKALIPVFREAAIKIVRAEKRKLNTPIEHILDEDGVDKFNRIVESFYESEGELSKFASKTMDPAFRALAEAIIPIAVEEAQIEQHDATRLVDALVASFGERYAALSRRRINELSLKHQLDDEAYQESLTSQLANWEEVRSQTVANVETSKAKSAIARSVFVSAGVLAIRWVSFGENCPICDGLNGQTVGVTENFASQGTDVGPDGNTIKTRTDITHPPIHDGCDCDIVVG